MKGKNTLKVNIDTMHEAMQLWVSQEFTFEPKPRVIAVRQIQATTYPEPGTPGFYEIDVESGESEPQKQSPEG